VHVARAVRANRAPSMVAAYMLPIVREWTDMPDWHREQLEAQV